MGVRYIDATDLGRHGYRSGQGESNGIVYTCRGGHVDIAHLRKLADWTAYLAYHLRDALVRGDEEFSFKMFEPTRHHVELQYPAGWQYIKAEARKEIATQISISLGEHLAYTASIWHEILTWYGFKAIGFYPEYNSAFSWEDNFSNALGCRIAGLALRDDEHDYDEAIALHTEREMARLGPHSKETAKGAGDAVCDWWFRGAFIRVVMIKRHLDVGLDDGYVTPWLVPEVGGCGAAMPEPCPVPDLEPLAIYGFRMKHEIEPREWERHKILRTVYPDRATRRKRIEPAKHLGIVIEHIRAEADERYGPYATVREANVPARFKGLSEAAFASSEYDASGRTEGERSDQTNKRKRGLLEFLGSAVSWLVPL